jgi:hypothetical protein
LREAVRALNPAAPDAEVDSLLGEDRQS